MENLIKEIARITAETRELEARACGYRKEIELGMADEDNITRYSLFENLVDAKDGMSSIQDDLHDIREKLSALLDELEYEKIRQEAGL